MHFQSSINPLSSFSSSIHPRAIPIIGLSIGLGAEREAGPATPRGTMGIIGLEDCQSFDSARLQRQNSYYKSSTVLTRSVWRSIHSFRIWIKDITFSARTSNSSQSQYMRSWNLLGSARECVHMYGGLHRLPRGTLQCTISPWSRCVGRQRAGRYHTFVRGSPP